jgi:hypothetical protein
LHAEDVPPVQRPSEDRSVKARRLGAFALLAIVATVTSGALLAYEDVGGW